MAACPVRGTFPVDCHFISVMRTQQSSLQIFLVAPDHNFKLYKPQIFQTIYSILCAFIVLCIRAAREPENNNDSGLLPEKCGRP